MVIDDDRRPQVSSVTRHLIVCIVCGTTQFDSTRFESYSIVVLLRINLLLSIEKNNIPGCCTTRYRTYQCTLNRAHRSGLVNDSPLWNIVMTVSLPAHTRGRQCISPQ